MTEKTDEEIQEETNLEAMIRIRLAKIQAESEMLEDIFKL